MSDKSAQEITKHGAIRQLFKGVMTGAARQGWMIGLMDGAVNNLEIVLEDVKEDLVRAPNDKIAGRVVTVLEVAMREIRELSGELGRSASGEN